MIRSIALRAVAWACMQPSLRGATVFLLSQVGLSKQDVSRVMSRFVSNFTNRLDAKGRVSIPAPFRAVLVRDGFEGLYVHPALDAPALDAGGNALLNEIDALLSTMAPYSDERDQLSTALFGTSEILKVDGEGRVILTDTVKVHAGIVDTVTFVGLGQKFQIWEPERFRAHLEAARAKVRELKRGLGLRVPLGAPVADREGCVPQNHPPGVRDR